MSKVRIQKVLAEAGVASRRTAEALILEGRVEVNGKLVRQIPCFVDVDRDEIRVDGAAIGRPAARKTYFLLNKPKGVVCSRVDPHGRLRVYDIVPAMAGQTYCLGGLDVDATGLVLLTNDGDLYDRLSHPRYGVSRRYIVEVDGRVEEVTIKRLKAGIFIDNRRTAPAKVRLIRRSNDRTLLEVELAETGGRELRAILARLGHRSRRLKRTGIGPIGDEGVNIGRFRMLRPAEVAALKVGKTSHK